MLTLENISTTNFESIPIDPFWNSGDEKELGMHRIHAYPAKFPSFITTKALDYALNENLKVEKIADMFCGCGTTAFESRRNDIDFWGCDINPVATMIARTKSRKYQNSRLEKYFEKIVLMFNLKNSEEKYSEANERLKYWFRKEQYNDLYKLKKIIEEITPKNSSYRNFFICAFSNILKPTSVWLTKSIKPQVDLNKNPADVIEAFSSQCKFMINANKQSDLRNNSFSQIHTGNFLDNSLPIPEVDMIITSPPYVTSYEYADLHQLSSIWLGFVDDYRELRKGTIGSVHQDYNFNREWKYLNNSGMKIVSRLYTDQKSKAKSIARYFLDIQKVSTKSFNMLRSNGISVFVIGNTEYKGVIIDNAKHLCESMQNSGFAEIKITKRKISKKILTPYRDEKGRFTTNSGGRKVYSEEFIVIGRK